ncbi:MAG: efflux RND transporter periplasmic adaptor subunit [Runella sp.]
MSAVLHRHTLLLYFFIASFLHFFIFSCSPKPNYEEEAQNTTQAAMPPVAVQTTVAEVRPFALILLSNGRIMANAQSKLSFRAAGVIEKILVRNGEAVRAGQLMAQLQNREQQLAIQQATLQIAEAQVEINDLLISQGGRKADSTSVKPEVWTYIKLRSGYERALLNLQKARNDLENTYLRAPYAGTVANLKLKPYNSTTPSEVFCVLLSKASVMVEFPVLETELAMVQVGQVAGLTPIAYPDKRYQARVVEINPLVSEQGLVQVKAQILNPDATLYEGMNARVRVEKNLARQLVLPKEAIVERSGRKVVFSYAPQNDTLGLAKWNYVTIAYENDRQVAIGEGIKAGDRVIVEGNLNLGHDAKVKIIKE